MPLVIDSVSIKNILSWLSKCNVCHKRGVEMARERQEGQIEHNRRGAFRLDMRSTSPGSVGTSERQNVKISARISGDSRCIGCGFAPGCTVNMLLVV